VFCQQVHFYANQAHFYMQGFAQTRSEKEAQCNLEMACSLGTT